MLINKNNIYANLLNIYNDLRKKYIDIIESQIDILSNNMIDIIRKLKIGTHKRKNNTNKSYEILDNMYLLKIKLTLDIVDYNYIISLLYKYMVPEIYKFIISKIENNGDNEIKIIKFRYIYELILQKNIFYIKNGYLYIVFLRT